MSETQSIKSKAQIKNLTIKFVCPTCSKSNKVTILSPRFYTNNMLISVIDKVKYLASHICKHCYTKMHIKYIRCVL